MPQKFDEVSELGEQDTLEIKSSDRHSSTETKQEKSIRYKIHLSTKVLLIWRLVAGLALFVLLILDFVRFKEKTLYFMVKYLSFWGFNVTLGYFVAVSIVQPEKTKRAKILSILLSYTFSMNLCISIIYFGFLYSFVLWPTPYDHALGLFKHCLPLILSLVDIVISRYKEYLVHNFVFSFSMILVYGIINIIFTFAEGEPVYTIFDWVSWWSYLSIIGLLVVMSIGIMVKWGIMKLKVKK